MGPIMAKRSRSVTESTHVRGPRKERSAGVAAARFSTHKARAAWFQARAAYPVREANVDKLTRQRKQFAAATGGPDVVWELIGPINTGGRCTSIAVHPANADVIYIGAAGGGVWKSVDAGQTWSSQWHAEGSLNVGALAIDPTNPDTVYCGTGEANLSADSYGGVGLYRTTDGGNTWKLFAGADKAGLPRRIGTIAVDPFDSTHVCLGGVRHAKTEVAGMYTSHDGGKTWAKETFVAGDYFCHHIVFHPSVQGTLFATVDANGTANGIWRSTDGGANWQHLTKGLPSAASIHRTSLAIAPSKPDTMYAISATAGEGVLGVFRSVNGGQSWTSIGGTHFKKETQMSYGNAIAVHPTNPKIVICGGVDLHATKDGGKTWKQATRWDLDRGKARYAHADHHALVMPAAKPGRIFDANDGGMDLSDDSGVTWANRSAGLAATMFYDLDVSQTDGRVYGGGAQDNGTVITTDGDGNHFFEILGGDGGWMLIDPKDAGHILASYYNFNIQRLRGGKWTDITPSMADSEHQSVWMVYITFDPSDSNTIYTASQRVWKTTNDGASWAAVSGVLDGTVVSAIEVAPANPKAVYVGTEKGGFFRSTDGGATWSDDLSSTVLAGSIITRIETHPKNAKQVFVTVGGFGHSHLFRTDDGGQSWADADAGKLPDAPHQAVAFWDDQTLLVAGDAGVFRSQDGGVTFDNISGNLPNTMFVDLVCQAKDGTVTVATYGRSLWRATVV